MVRTVSVTASWCARKPVDNSWGRRRARLPVRARCPWVVSAHTVTDDLRLPAADAAFQVGDQVVGAQFVQVAQTLAQSGAQRGVGVGGQAGQLSGGGEAAGCQQSQ